MMLKDYFIDKIRDIPEVYIYGNPTLSIIAVNSNEININTIANELKIRAGKLMCSSFHEDSIFSSLHTIQKKY